MKLLQEKDKVTEYQIIDMMSNHIIHGDYSILRCRYCNSMFMIPDKKEWEYNEICESCESAFINDVAERMAEDRIKSVIIGQTYIRQINCIEAISKALYNNKKASKLFYIDLYNVEGIKLEWRNPKYEKYDESGIRNGISERGSYLPCRCLHKAIKTAAEALMETIIYTVEFSMDYIPRKFYKSYRINGKTGEYESVSLEWLNSKLPPHERMMEGNFELPDEPPEFK